ncbi:MAG: MBL fold metallo-hydrolase [Candidatus Helarchaeota archaeon]
MKITFLGTVGSALTKDLSYSSILINDDLLIDCGEGTTQKLIALNCINKIKMICISHLHNDHFLGLFSLLWYYWILRQDPTPLKIVGPPKLAFTVNSILDLINTPNNVLNLEFEMLEDNQEIQLINNDKYKIQSIQVEHIPISFAYRIEDPKSHKSICYTGDTRPNPNIIKLSNKADLLICESTFPDDMTEFAHKYYHCTPSDAAEIALQSHAKKLAITHISALFQNKSSLNKIKKQAENKFKNNIIIAKDMMSLGI